MIRIKFKKSQSSKVRKHLRNKARIRKKIFGTQEIPRLNVFKSGRHIYAQAIDDNQAITISSYSSLQIKNKDMSSIEKAKQVGQMLAKNILKKKCEKVIFDRGGFLYHGRIKALADAARETGLKF